MARLIGAIVLVVLVVAAIRLAILAIVLAGLIFRTQVTIGLLLTGGVLALLAAYPGVGVAALGIAAAVAIAKAARQATVSIDDPVQD